METPTIIQVQQEQQLSRIDISILELLNCPFAYKEEESTDVTTIGYFEITFHRPIPTGGFHWLCNVSLPTYRGNSAAITGNVYQRGHNGNTMGSALRSTVYMMVREKGMEWFANGLIVGNYHTDILISSIMGTKDIDDEEQELWIERTESLRSMIIELFGGIYATTFETTPVVGLPELLNRITRNTIDIHKERIASAKVRRKAKRRRT